MGKILGLLNLMLWIALPLTIAFNMDNPDSYEWAMRIVFVIAMSGLIQANIEGGHKNTLWVKAISHDIENQMNLKEKQENQYKGRDYSEYINDNDETIVEEFEQTGAHETGLSPSYNATASLHDSKF